MTAIEIAICLVALSVLLTIGGCCLWVNWPDINPFPREEYRPQITDQRHRYTCRARF